MCEFEKGELTHGEALLFDRIERLAAQAEKNSDHRANFWFHVPCAESIANAIERGMEQFASRQTPVALRTWSNVADDHIGICQDILSASGGAGDDF